MRGVKTTSLEAVFYSQNVSPIIAVGIISYKKQIKMKLRMDMEYHLHFYNSMSQYVTKIAP